MFVISPKLIIPLKCIEISFSPNLIIYVAFLVSLPADLIELCLLLIVAFFDLIISNLLFPDALTFFYKEILRYFGIS